MARRRARHGNPFAILDRLARPRILLTTGGGLPSQTEYTVFQARPGHSGHSIADPLGPNETHCPMTAAGRFPDIRHDCRRQTMTSNGAAHPSAQVF
jgi:hypothetical protein